MKYIAKLIGGWVIAGVGYTAGTWLWQNVLESKATKIKNRLTK